jgi:hypothetical protein
MAFQVGGNVRICRKSLICDFDICKKAVSVHGCSIVIHLSSEYSSLVICDNLRTFCIIQTLFASVYKINEKYVASVMLSLIAIHTDPDIIYSPNRYIYVFIK